MNRYTAEGLAADLVRGAQVTVLSASHVASGAAADMVTRELMPSDIESQSRSNGDRRVRLYSGGTVRFLPLTQRSLQGWRPQPRMVVVLDAQLTHDQRADFAAHCNGVVGWELIE